MRLPTKIPTILALLLLAVIVAAIVFAFEGFIRLPTLATASSKPQQIEITNLGDTQFSVTWITDTPTTGVVRLTSPKSQVFYDDRDLAGGLTKYLNHSIMLRNLNANTTYAYEILSNGKSFTRGELPTVKTLPSLPIGENLGRQPAYGQVIFENETGESLPAQGALVYLTPEGGQTLSTLTKASGAWLIPLNLTRTTTGEEFLSLGERLTETVRVKFNNFQSSALTDTFNDTPVPLMLVGKNYDFRGLQGKTGNVLVQKSESFPTILGASNSNFTIALTAPAQNAVITSAYPFIAGTGFPGKLVTITLGVNTPQSGTTTVKGDGVWNFTPQKPLESGRQSVTMTTFNQNNQPVALTHLFTILKSGTQVLGDATPSATPTLFPTSTPLTPTPISTLAGEPLPTSGSILPTIILLILSSVLLLGGGVIAFSKFNI